MDDIYFAFRTPDLLSINYFAHPDTGEPLRPDVIVLGKALAAGYPLSCIAGRDGFLNSYDKKFLLRLNKTVGTLAAWHGGIVASNVFLEALLEDGGGRRPDGAPLLEIPARDQLASLVRKCDAFAEDLNAELSRSGLPVRVRNFGNTFSVDFLSEASSFSILASSATAPTTVESSSKSCSSFFLRAVFLTLISFASLPSAATKEDVSAASPAANLVESSSKSCSSFLLRAVFFLALTFFACLPSDAPAKKDDSAASPAANFASAIY